MSAGESCFEAGSRFMRGNRWRFLIDIERHHRRLLRGRVGPIDRLGKTASRIARIDAEVNRCDLQGAKPDRRLPIGILIRRLRGHCRTGLK